MNNTSDIELLYGKSLQTIVTTALTTLQQKQTDKILIKTILAEIIEQRPQLKQFVSSSADKQKVLFRITNCVRKLNQTGLVTLEKVQVKHVNFSYLEVKPNLL